jgi:ubiquinone/menaquinone biosynthesis C-methylase UbiE
MKKSVSGGKKMDFNAEAAKWDNERRAKRAKIIADEIIKSIPIEKQFRALEFGCGTGLVSFNLKDSFEKITLVDTSEGMIETLNSKIQEFKLKNMKAIKCDINSDSKLKHEKFHVIYTSMVLHHIMDVKITLKNLYDLIIDDGYLCIVDLVEDDGSFHKLEKDFDGHNGFNQSELRNILEDIGFKDAAVNVFYNDVKVMEDLKVNYSLFLMVGKR